MTDPIAYVEGQLQSIVAGQEKLHAQIKTLVKERNALRAALVDLVNRADGVTITDAAGNRFRKVLEDDLMKAMTIIRGALGT